MTPPVTKNQSLADILNEIESRANAATPGPWYQDPTNDIGEWLVGTSLLPVADCDFAELTGKTIQNNAAFIASSRTDVPKLVKALRHALKHWGHGVEEEVALILTSPENGEQRDS